jgi:O-antigen ligase
MKIKKMKVKADFQEFYIFFLVVLYCFTVFISEKTNSLIQILLWIYFAFLIIKNPCSFRRDKMTLLFWAAIGVQIISWAGMKFTFPEFSYHVPKIDRLGKLFLFIPIAWGLKRYNSRFINYIFLSALIGFFIGIIIHSDFLSQISNGIKGYRTDFGIRNAQHTSMIFGMIFIVSFLNLFIFEERKIYLHVLFVILIIFSFTGIVLTQTRQTYFAIAMTCLAAAPAVYSMNFRVNKKILLLVMIIVSGLIFSVNMENFFHRFNETSKIILSMKKIHSVEKELSGFNEKIDLYVKNIPDSSTGVRIKSSLEAFKWTLKKPFFGWGSEARGLVIEESKNFSKQFKQKFGHLHNYFVEVLVSYGLAGISVVAFLYYLVLNSAYKIRSCLKDGPNNFLIGTCFVSYWVIMNNFESFNSFWTGVFVHNMFCGCIYSRYLTVKKISKKVNEQ